MERLIFFLALGLLASCTPGKDGYDAWNAPFARAPQAFARTVTALWIANYQEDPQSHQFVRSTSWGDVPEKLIPDQQGGYSVAIPLLVQSETSDGPRPDRFSTLLVRVIRTGDRFTLVDNDALPGEVRGWHDPSRRTVWFRGMTTGVSGQTLWQFQGRY